MGDRLATIDMDQKVGAVPLSRRELGPPSNNAAWTEAYLRTKWHLDSSSRLATTDMGRKLGCCAPLGEGQLDPRLTQCGQG